LEPGHNKEIVRPEGDLEKTIKQSSEKISENTQYLQAVPKTEEPEKKSSPLGYVLGGLIALGSMANILYFTIWYPGKRKNKEQER